MTNLHDHQDAERLRHVLVVGATGSGKTSWLRALTLRDLVLRRGLLLLDPHGDLVDDVLALVPRHRKNDVVLVDPHRTDCPALNPLRGMSDETRDLKVSAIVATIRKLFDGAFWGPRSEHLLRNVLLALAEVRGATLLDAQRMLVDEAHRAWVLRQVSDPIVLAFWTREFPGYGRQLAPEVTAPLQNKLGALLATRVLRDVLTKTRPRFDAARAMARGAVVLARLSKGELGETAAYFLGGTILGAFQAAIMARAALPPSERSIFAITIDEATSLPMVVLRELLAEGRKYGAALTIATQSLAALPPDDRAGLLANAGTLVSFRVGGEDAEILSRELAFKYGAPTLTSLDMGEMVVRVGASPARHIANGSRPPPG